MYKAIHVSPMIPSFDLKATGAFFEDLLGFTSTMNEPSYAIFQKDQHTIHILPAGNDIGEMEFYLEVDDIEAVWNGLKDKLNGIKAKAPFDRDYGMREVHLIVPHTKTLLFIGQSIA